MSLKGRSTTATSFLLFQLWYHAKILPLSDQMIKRFKDLIWSFMWKGRQNRVAADKCTQKIEKGGLGMLDVQRMVDAIRCQWVRQLMDSNEHQWKCLANWVLTNSADTNEEGIISCLWTQKTPKNRTANLPTLWKQILASW